MYKYNSNSPEYQKLLEELKLYYINILKESEFGYNVYSVLRFMKSDNNNYDYIVSVKLEKKYKLTGYHYVIEHHYLSELQLNNISRINKLNKLCQTT